LRIAAISHSCVIDVNQQLYVELAGRPDVKLLLIAPDQWDSSLRGDTAFSCLPELKDLAHPLPTAFPGHIHLHWYRGLGPVLQEFEPDVLYVDEEPYSLVTTQALGRQRRLGCKLVFYTKQNLFKRYFPPFSFMQKRALDCADHAMVVSDEAAEVLRAKGYTGTMTELPHGIDPQLVAPHDSEPLRARLGIKAPIIGYVGRIAAEKGVWDLLESARVLADRIGPNFTVVVIGDGPDRWRLEAAAERQLPSGTFFFTGAVAHHAVPDYLNLLDVLVLPSRTRPHWKEQFGRVLVESLACGVPLVGSTSGQIPAVIKDTGGGLVFEEGNVVDLADKLQTLLEDPDMAQSMAEKGRAVVAERYSYKRVAEILYGALKQVADG